jgi:hypothetical protein
MWFSLVSIGKFWDSTALRPLLLPSKSFRIHQSSSTRRYTASFNNQQRKALSRDGVIWICDSVYCTL